MKDWGFLGLRVSEGLRFIRVWALLRFGVNEGLTSVKVQGLSNLKDDG